MALIFKKNILIILVLLFSVITGYFYNNRSFHFRFVDEEDNFTIGKYLSKGEILYDDIITNHQPLTYIFSSIIQNYTNPNSVYSLLIRYRQAEIIWSVIWSILLVFYFGIGAFIAILIYGLTKFYLLGDLFLAEAQIVYPLLFLTGIVIFHKKELKKLELIFIGICFALALFLLSPLWLAITFLLMIFLYKNRHKLIHNLGLMSLGFILPVLLIYQFTSLIGYFYYTFYINLVYTVPGYHQEPWLITAIRAFFTPFMALLSQREGPTAIIIKLLSLLLIISMIILIFRKKYFLVAGIFILLGLSNIRFINPGDQEYTGFHLLPWYAILIFVTSLLSIEVFKKNNIIVKILISLILTLTIGLSINFVRSDLFQRKNMLSDYNVNYSTAINRGDAVRSMKDTGDTLFVSPNAWLIYWQSDIDHLPKLYGYYTWMSGIPKIHNAVLEAFEKNPPAFFYCENCQGLDLEKFLDKYIELKNYGNKSFLYVIKSKVGKLTDKQLEQLKFYGFSFN